MVQEFSGGAGTIGTNQQLLTNQHAVLVVEVIGQHLQGLGERLDMILRAVRSLVARAQQHREDFPGALALPVIGGRDHWCEPVAALVGAGSALFVRMRLHECGVNVQDQGVGTGGALRGVPVSGSGPEPGAQGFVHALIPVGDGFAHVFDPSHEPGHGRFRSDGAEDAGAGAQQVNVAGLLTACGEHHGQVRHDFPRPMTRRFGNELGEPVLAQGP